MSFLETVKIVPARWEHAGYIAANVREADEREIRAACGMSPLEAMLKGMERSDQVMTGFVNGVPVCMWGVVNESFIGHVGTPWMVGTYMLDRYAKAFLRRCKRPVMEMLDNYDMLQNYVDARNTRSIQWLKWLGFKINPEPESYGLSRLPFHKFTMRRESHV